MRPLLLLVLITLSITAPILTPVSVDRSQSDVYNCLKPIINVGGLCRTQISACYTNSDCSVEFDSANCVVSNTNSPFSTCKKWAYKTLEADSLAQCLDSHCKLFT